MSTKAEKLRLAKEKAAAKQKEMEENDAGNQNAVTLSKEQAEAAEKIRKEKEEALKKGGNAVPAKTGGGGGSGPTQVPNNTSPYKETAQQKQYREELERKFKENQEALDKKEAEERLAEAKRLEEIRKKAAQQNTSPNNNNNNNSGGGGVFVPNQVCGLNLQEANRLLKEANDKVVQLEKRVKEKEQEKQDGIKFVLEGVTEAREEEERRHSIEKSNYEDHLDNVYTANKELKEKLAKAERLEEDLVAVVKIRENEVKTHTNTISYLEGMVAYLEEERRKEQEKRAKLEVELARESKKTVAEVRKLLGFSSSLAIETTTLDTLHSRGQLDFALETGVIKSKHSLRLKFDNKDIATPLEMTLSQLKLVRDPNERQNEKKRLVATKFGKVGGRLYESVPSELRKDTISAEGELTVTLINNVTQTAVLEKNFSYDMTSATGERTFDLIADEVRLRVNNLGNDTFNLKMIAVAIAV